MAQEMWFKGEAERCSTQPDSAAKIEQHRGSESGAVQRKIGEAETPLPQEPSWSPSSPRTTLPTGLGLQVCTHAHPRLLGRHLCLALLEGQVGRCWGCRVHVG